MVSGYITVSTYMRRSGQKWAEEKNYCSGAGQDESHGSHHLQVAHGIYLVDVSDPLSLSPAGQCCGSGMFIPDPGSRIRFFPSRIQGWQGLGYVYLDLVFFLGALRNPFSSLFKKDYRWVFFFSPTPKMLWIFLPLPENLLSSIRIHVIKMNVFHMDANPDPKHCSC
jgi:hypothetical protein